MKGAATVLASAAVLIIEANAGLLWPHPQTFTPAQPAAQLGVDSTSFKINAPTSSSPQQKYFQDSVSRYSKIFFVEQLNYYPPGNGSDVAAPVGAPAIPSLSSLDVKITDDTVPLELGVDESYELSLPAAGGAASLQAKTVWGAMRGLETFSQLLDWTGDGNAFEATACSIQDAPRFGWRGVMIDTARHFLSMDTIRSVLDAMSYSKQNRLHWHLVDDQSFPFESKTFPALAGKGAFYAPETTHTYSAADVQTVLDYAMSRGISVVPEFDTPGHTASWGLGYPNLLTECYGTDGKPDGTRYAVDPTLNSTWAFLDAFFGEVEGVFPDPYVHIGGDEVSFTCWQSNPAVQAWMKNRGWTDYSKLENYYVQRVIDLVAGNHNRSIIGWQELFDNGLNLPSDTVVDVWKGHGSPAWKTEMDQVTKAGHRGLLSAPYYINYISYGATWENYYTPEPTDFGGSTEQEALVMGTQACIWGEWVGSTDLISRLYPSASAVAERGWSDKSKNSVDEAAPRLHAHRCRMNYRGLPAEP